jgi:hypothetical protein
MCHLLAGTRAGRPPHGAMRVLAGSLVLDHVSLQLANADAFHDALLFCLVGGASEGSCEGPEESVRLLSDSCSVVYLVAKERALFCEIL